MTRFTAPDDARVVLSSFIQPISIFGSCLRGVAALEVGLAQLCAVVGAEAVLLSRRLVAEPRAVTVAKSDRSRAKLGTLSRPFCDDILEIDPWSLQVGACVFRSRLDAPSEQSQRILDRWDAASGTRDSAVMVLDVTRRQVDRLEFHFSHLADARTVHLCDEIAKALPLLYASRMPDVISQAISRNRKAGGKPAGSSTAPILSQSNPYQLTRSEFRMCHVIGRGLSYRALPDELGISAHTVRSHLRNIYAKLDVSDFYELSHRLVSIQERMAAHNLALMAS